MPCRVSCDWNLRWCGEREEASLVRDHVIDAEADELPARLADHCQHIHVFGQPFIAAEYSTDVYVHDMNIAYAELAGTRKHFALGIAVVDHIEPIISLFDTYLGREGAFLWDGWDRGTKTTFELGAR